MPVSYFPLVVTLSLLLFPLAGRLAGKKPFAAASAMSFGVLLLLLLTSPAAS